MISMNYNFVKSDVLVIGGGSAGLRASIEAKKRDVSVTLVTKRSLGSGSTAVAGSGHACVLPPEYGGNPEDSLKTHFNDTIEGGCSINDQRLVKFLVENGAKQVLELQELGVVLGYVPFSEAREKPPGEGHSFGRIIRVDGGGGNLIYSLTRKAKELAVEMKEDIMIVDLLISNGMAKGAIGFNTKSDSFSVFVSKATILATGGAGQIYPLTSCMIDGTGDGYAIAYRAGCILQDMEFVQFYPWRLISPPLYNESVLYDRVPIQSNVFTRGGKLLNSQGERFMEKVDPSRKDLTTRDVAARAIYNEIKEGRAVNGGVLLDISEISEEDFLSSDRRYSLFKKRGVDIRQAKMIVAPEAHYFMGGIHIDENCETNIKGLYAAGEVIGGFDGANRLSGNALTMCQVTGRRAGVQASIRAIEFEETPDIKEEAVSKKIGEVQSYLKEGKSFEVLRKELQKLMWDKVGIVRTGHELEQALKRIEGLRVELNAVGASNYQELKGTLELRNMLCVSEMLTRAAMLREESRGAHYRLDHPKRDDEYWMVNIRISLRLEKMILLKAPAIDLKGQ